MSSASQDKLPPGLCVPAHSPTKQIHHKRKIDSNLTNPPVTGGHSAQMQTGTFEYSEIAKLYTGSLGERKTIENHILSEGPEARLFMLSSKNKYSQ